MRQPRRSGEFWSDLFLKQFNNSQICKGESKMTRKIMLFMTIVFLALCFSASMVFACNGPGCVQVKTENLCAKTPTDTGEWPCVAGGAYGDLNYINAASKFSFFFDGHKLTAGGAYTLVYYPDPWPAAGLVCLANGYASKNTKYRKGGDIRLAGSVELNSDLPMSFDANASDGAKVWLVSSSDVNCSSPTSFAGWNPTEYLFEKEMKDRVFYDDTDLIEVIDTVDINTNPVLPATVECVPAGRCISFYPEQNGGWGGEYPNGAVTAFPGDNDFAGYVILNSGKGRAKEINIRHLDGGDDDSFEVFALDASGNWTSLGVYLDNGLGTETWVETPFSLAGVKLSGPNISIKIMPATDPTVGQYYSGYGHLAIDKVVLMGKFLCGDFNPK
jgi:hypothetical protein